MNETRPPSFEQFVTFYPTSDLALTAEFWLGYLGCTLALDQGTCHIYRVTGNAFIGFCQRSSVVVEEGVIITLVTPKVDAWFRYLEGKEVELEGAPTLNPKYNIYHFFFRDPMGHLVEIQRFEDPSWPAPYRLVE